jgi:hypothetical protein
MEVISKEKAWWKSLHTNTRFSILGFIISLALGLLSMGALGGGLYYTLLPTIKNHFPPFNSWSGDWVWPALIGSGMLWSVGFILAGLGCHYLIKINSPKFLCVLVYIFILWVWINAVWYLILSQQVF